MADRVASLRVAVAEDDSDLRQVMVKLIELLGHRVVLSVPDGTELLARCAAGQVDVVLTDLDMPNVDGLAAAEDLANKGVPVILVSGHQDVDRVVVENEPIVASVRKPISLATLESALELARQRIG